MKVTHKQQKTLYYKSCVFRYAKWLIHDSRGVVPFFHRTREEGRHNYLTDETWFSVLDRQYSKVVKVVQDPPTDKAVSQHYKTRGAMTAELRCLIRLSVSSQALIVCMIYVQQNDRHWFSWLSPNVELVQWFIRMSEWPARTIFTPLATVISRWLMKIVNRMTS